MAVVDGNSQSWVELLIQHFGLPGAVVIGVGVSLYKGWFQTKREVDGREKLFIQTITVLQGQMNIERHDHNAAMKQMHDEYEARIKEVQQQCELRIDRVREERSYWREQAFKNFETLRQAAMTTDKAVEALAAREVDPPPKDGGD